MAKIFFSYSHVDEDLRDELQKHLAVMQRAGLISTWHDRRLMAGDNLGGEIQKNLDDADVVLLLVTKDFLASGYCYDIEFQRALERHRAGEARVIPIILKHCDWLSTPMRELVAAPRDGRPVVSWPDRDEAFLDVTKRIREYAESLKASGAHRSREPIVSAVTSSEHERPRSSNLAIKKEFSQAEKDLFLHDAFEYISLFFEESLKEIQKRNNGVEARYRKIDANRFTAAIYRGGSKKASCTIQIGNFFGSGIAYSQSDSAAGNGFNESLSVKSDDQKIYLEPMGMGFLGSGKGSKFTFQGAAEYYWEILIRDLQ